MKKVRLFLLTVTLAMLSITGMAFAAGNGHGGGVTNDPITILPLQELNDNETAALLKMREEEKLARDVYLTLYEKWNLQIFYDIAQSEQNHTDMVKQLIEKYQLTDPVTDDTVGAFTQAGFSELYQQLVDEGSKSEIDALKVGATIEDLDISDLDHELTLTDNDDVKQVFENLRNGSYNHMRSFISALEAYGETYTPQYISQEEFENILNSGSSMQYGKKGSNYVQLPGKMNRLSFEQKQRFSFQPTMSVSDSYDNQTAELFAILYSESAKQYYILTSPNNFQPWTPGEEIVPFSTETLTGEDITFPIITNTLDLSGLTGTFDFFYGFKVDNDSLIYTSDQLIFE